MDFDYNHIFKENRHATNNTLLVWMSILAGVLGIFWVLGLTGIITAYTWIYHICVPISAIFLVFPSIVSKLDKSINNNQLTKIIIASLILAVFSLSVSLSYHVAIAWIFPLILACQYCSRKLTRCTFAISLVGMIVSYYVSLYVGVWELSLIDAPSINTVRNISFDVIAAATWHLIPKVIMFCASYPMFAAITKRTELSLKKQKLSMMAFQARQSFDNMTNISEGFETDAKIKMRFLAKNGIDIDNALKAMNGNIEKYNDFVLTFLGESQRKKEELLSLLDKDTIIQYGAKVHSLRVKANALGLINLTDTAFFHEIEAYAGNIELVRLNWDKLSSEWDEIYDIYVKYIKSLGLNEHATDKDGNQMSFKKWGEQLHEAFNALETYDTIRAKKLLNELIQFQIDSDITKNLEILVASIDDILKA